MPYNKSIIFSIFILGFFSVAMDSQAYTFQRSGEAFRTADMPIPYYVDANNQPADADQWNLLHWAFQAWSEATAGKLSFVYKGLTTDAMLNHNISFLGPPNGNCSAYSAVTDGNKYTTGFTMRIGNNPTGTLIESNPELLIPTMKHVMLHEVGHALGLGHSDKTGSDEAIMQASFNVYTPFYDLKPDDIAGIRALYPPDNERPIGRLSVNPSHGLPNLSVTLDASASSDLDGRIIGYEFNFGDGSPLLAASNPVTTHTYALPEGLTQKTFVPNVKVTDDKNGIDLLSDTYAPVLVSTDATPPSAPAALAAEVSPNSVILSWNAVSDAANYFIYRGQNPGGPYSQLTSVLSVKTTYTDANVAAGNIYYYVVTAEDSSRNESAYSNETAANLATCKTGDSNCDGQVNISDVQVCINVLLGADNNPDHQTRCDLNGKGINITDIQTIINIILGI